MKALILPDGFTGATDPGVAMWDQSPLVTLPLGGRPVLAREVDALSGLGITQTLVLAEHHPHAIRTALQEVNSQHWRLLYPGPDDAPGSLSRAWPLVEDSLLILDGQVGFSAHDIERAIAVSQGADALRLCCLQTGAVALILHGTTLELLRSHTARSLSAHLKACRRTGERVVRELWTEGEPRRDIGFLLREQTGRPAADTVFTEARPGIWVHPSARVPRDVLQAASGPVLIGAGCRIHSGVTLQGPVEIGAGCQVERGAVLAESYIAPGTRVGDNVELCQKVARGELLYSATDRHTVRIEEPTLLSTWSTSPLPHRLRSALVRGLESLAAGLALVLLSPLLLSAAALVRASSTGPILYRGRRTIRPRRIALRPDAYLHDSGETVPYPVFRTMIDGADQLDEAKRSSNLYTSGPFRKFADDSRVTPMGSLLRKTSIDELPLLWEVMRGRLSLVGLWALPGREADQLHRAEMPLAGRHFEETARLRFQGRPGLAGLWQSQGRSALTAEQRALYDAYQAVVTGPKPLPGAYRRYTTLSGRARLLMQTLTSVISRQGAL